MSLKWYADAYKKKVRDGALDGIEEWCRVRWKTQAVSDCPVKEGTMRDSLGVQRESDHCKVGGGGAAKSYISRQEFDRSLNHPVGKAGFIRDSVDMHKAEIPQFVKKHVK